MLRRGLSDWRHLVAASIAVGILGCGLLGAPPSVVLVTLDTLNVRYVGAYTDGVELTPTLDRLAADGTVFEQAHTRVPITLPAHTAILSGRPSDRIGVWANGDRVPDDVRLLPEILAGRGYETAAFVSLGVLRSNFGLDRGFSTYDDDFEASLGRWYRYADEVLAPVGRWLDDRRDRNPAAPFFLWVHLSDPHEPYLAAEAPPDTTATLDGDELGRWTLGERGRHLLQFELSPGTHDLVFSALSHRLGTPVVEIVGSTALAPHVDEVPGGRRRLDAPWRIEVANDGREPTTVGIVITGRLENQPRAAVLEQYRREVRATDRAVGELWRRLGDEDVVWVVVSDHGEGLFHHGVNGHARHVWEDQLRTAFIVAGPGIPSGRRIDRPVLLSDVTPTLLDLLDLPIPGEMTGTVQALRTRQEPSTDPRHWWAYGLTGDESSRLASLAAYRWPHKRIWSTRSGHHVFDLVEDPWERADLVATGREPGSELHRSSQRLRGQIERLRPSLERRMRERPVESLSEEEREMLRGLGYID